MSVAQVDLPPAWITEDDVLFLVYRVYSAEKMIDAANAVLQEVGYDERVTWRDVPFGRMHAVRYVDPGYIRTERWPESAVSSEPVEGWVKLYRLDIGDLRIPGGSGS